MRPGYVLSQPEEVKVSRAWTTNFGLTTGIEEHRDAVIVNNSGVKGRWTGRKDWHLSLEDAQRRVDEMRRERIERLKKQIAKWEALLGKPAPVVVRKARP